jgi:uncharacterized delta-60 repeat protein
MRSDPHLPFAFAAVLAAACSTPDPLYCDEDTPCEDPDRPFCDLDGTYPASDGIGRTCIAEPSFSISLSDSDAQVRIAGELELDVTVDRVGDFPGDITITAADLPPGTTAASLTIPDGQTTGTLVIQASDADPGAVAVARVIAISGRFASTADLRLLVLGPAGSLDPTFGTNGLAGQPSGTGMDDSALLVRLTGGGFIVAGASTDQSVGVLVRFSEEGELDEDFGASGWAAVDLDGTAVDRSGNIELATRPDDTIVLAQGSETGDILLVAVTADAERDPTFGDGGVVADTVANGVLLSVVQVAAAPNGDILVATAADTVPELLYVLRYTADGQRDPTFASDGRLELDRGSSPSISALAVLGDGSILVVGSAVNGTRLPFSVKLTPNGLPDSDYGADGEPVLPPGWEISDAQVDADGRWLVGGSVDDIPAFFRLTATGEIDTNFGVEGALPIAVPEGLKGAIRAVLQGEGDVIGVGGPDVTMARLVAGELDAAFGENGTAYFELDTVRALRAVRLPDRRIVVLSDNDALPFVLARFFE